MMIEAFLGFVVALGLPLWLLAEELIRTTREWRVAADREDGRVPTLGPAAPERPSA
jgi:hypothetical protein